MIKKELSAGSLNSNGQPKLFLNNGEYTKRQNNIRSSESALILNTSAIDEMEGEICGTDSMNLLIKNWRNVAGSADTFRDFGLNSLDPMMSKIQKSIVNVDLINASNIGVNKGGNVSRIDADACIDEIIKAQYRPFDDKGQYGGDQLDNGSGTDFWITIWFEDDDTYNFVRKHRKYAKAGDGEVHDLLKRFGGHGCSYVAMTNVLFDQWPYNPEEFKSNFGFDMIKNGDLNFRELYLDFFIETDDVIYLDEPYGIECLAQMKLKHYMDHPEEYKEKYNEDLFYYENTSQSWKPTQEAHQNCVFEAIQDWKNGVTEVKAESQMTSEIATINRFSHYCREHGIELEFKVVPSMYDVDAVQRYLDMGYSGMIGATHYELQSPTPGVEPMQSDGAHMMSVTGTTADKKYTVSSCGGMYYLDPNYDKLMPAEVYLIKLKKAQSYGSLKEKLQSEMINFPGMYNGMSRDTKCMDIIKKYPDYANCSYDDAYKVIDKFEKKGAYAVLAAKTIIGTYQGKEKEFEEKFHLDMNREDVTDLLALDIFMETDNKVYFDDSIGKNCCAQYICNYYCKHPDEYKLKYNDNVFDANGNINSNMYDQFNSNCQKEAEEYAELARKSGKNEITLQAAPDMGEENYTTFQNRISHYFRENNIAANINMPDMKPSTEEVEQMLERGSKVVFWADYSTLYDENGLWCDANARERASNEFEITGVSHFNLSNGGTLTMYHVSCGGKSYLFNPEANESYIRGFCEIQTYGAVG